MKKLLIISVMIMLMLQSNAQFTKATLQATGLTCAMCSNAINKALQKVSFVESVKSDIKNSAFDIVFKQSAEVNIDALKDAVEDAGFSVGSLKMTGNFSDVKVVADQHVKIGNANFCFLDVSNQTLSGEKTITLVDKNFVTAKQFKKISLSTKMDCLQTGKAAACCSKDGLPADARVYHVTI
jgi:copper chaperone CopZ